MIFSDKKILEKIDLLPTRQEIDDWFDFLEDKRVECESCVELQDAVKGIRFDINRLHNEVNRLSNVINGLHTLDKEIRNLYEILEAKAIDRWKK